MSAIKVEILTTNSQITLYNEDIISLSTSTRSTSSPSTPTYGAFASDGMIVIRDENLDLYDKAQQGFFDNYYYPVKIYLYDETLNSNAGGYKIIATQIINRRPEYDYANKTLTISLSDKIAQADELKYVGYDFPLEPKSANDIFKDIMQSFLGMNDSNYTTLMNSVAYYDRTEQTSVSFGIIFQGTTITYPYLPSQITYREALASVLSLTHCALIMNANGNPRLIFLDKYLADIEDNNTIIISPDKTQEPFNTAVILDNKYDCAQVGATNVSATINSGNIYNYYNSDISINLNDVQAQQVISFDDNRDTQIDTNTYIGQYHPISSIKARDDYDGTYNAHYKAQSISITVPKYGDNNLKQVLSVDRITQSNITVNLRQDIKIYKSTGNPAITQFGTQYPLDSTYTEKVYDNNGERVVTMGVESGYPNPLYFTEDGNSITYYGWFCDDQNIRPNGILDVDRNTVIKYHNTAPTYDLFTDNDDNYTVTLNYKVTIGKHIEFYTIVAIGFKTDYDLEDIIAINNDDYKPVSYKYVIEETPISVEIGVNGVTRTINLDDMAVIGKNITTNNLAEIDSYNKLLQTGRDVSSAIVDTEVYNLLDYYNGGLHTANITVLGDVSYDKNSQGIVETYILDVTNGEATYSASNIVWLYTDRNFANDVCLVDGLSGRRTLTTDFYMFYNWSHEYNGGVLGTLLSIRKNEDGYIEVEQDLTYYDYNEPVFGIDVYIYIVEQLTTKDVFKCGDIVKVLNYDYVSPLSYQNISVINNDVSLRWQVTENNITFDGGAIYQELTLKEIAPIHTLLRTISDIEPITSIDWAYITYTYNASSNHLDSGLFVRYSGYIEYIGNDDTITNPLYTFSEINPDAVSSIGGTITINEYNVGNRNFTIEIDFQNVNSLRQAKHSVSTPMSGGNNQQTYYLSTKLVFTSIKVLYT